MKPAALVFDLDETLVIEEASVEAAYAETCAAVAEQCGVDKAALCATIRETCREFWHKAPAREYCISVGISSWEGLWANFEGDDDNLKILREWAPGYRSASWRNTLLKHGIDDAALSEQLAEGFRRNRRKYQTAYGDTHPMLAELGKKYKLGMLTNGAPDLQREKATSTDIARYFDVIVVSGEVGVGKPDRRVFEAVAGKLDVPFDRTWMIGDSLSADIKGGKGAGMTTVWLNRTGRTRDDSIVPDHEFKDLGELNAALERQ